MAQNQPQYVHYTGPPGSQAQPAPQPAARQSTPAHSTPQPPLVAVGDWTKNLVELAKTAELKKHALTLQLHTAHILSAHASLEQKTKAIQDVREQKNKLESERQRLLNCLRQVNEDRDKADLLESTIDRECTEIRQRITQISEGEYTEAKRDVDRLRQELGHPLSPVCRTPSMKSRRSEFLTERRLNGTEASSSSSSKRAAADDGAGAPPGKKRGRPKGSKNRTSSSSKAGPSTLQS
ncbi:hypothetical protein BDZ89DRAFT_1076234 [Hymenopellis radicata]|nr:hypothetical protein BDZ89DRAFT_1076234 [Hymenopellis radicata]